MMSTSTWIVWQLLAYSVPTWLGFIVLAFCAARFLGRVGVLAGFFLVAIILYVLDVRWATDAMNAPDWDGTLDLDMIFILGVLARVVLVNAVLLPITAFGFWLRCCNRCHHIKSNFA